MTEVDLFISTKRVKVLMADSQVQGTGLASGVGSCTEAPAAHPRLTCPSPGGPDGPHPADHLLHR